jgi:hypothetical protein
MSVTDTSGLSSSATVSVFVAAAAPIIASISTQVGGLQLSWSGGVAPYQVQAATNWQSNNWQTLAQSVSGNTWNIFPTNSSMFFRVSGQ